MIKAIIFDKDGVLVDSEYANIQSATEAFEQLGIHITDEDKKQIIGKHPDDYIVYFQTKYLFPVEEFKTLRRPIYNRIFENAPLFDDAISLVKSIKSSHLFLALTTSGGNKNTNDFLQKIKLDQVFDALVTKEMCSKRKPDPQPYLITAEELHVLPDECVVIEDSWVGLTAAKAAGMKCVVIPNDYTKDNDFSSADLIVKSAKEITVAIIKGLS